MKKFVMGALALMILVAAIWWPPARRPSTRRRGQRLPSRWRYPVDFESSFVQSGIAVGNKAADVQCVLDEIEHTVPYSTVEASAHDILTGNPPARYTTAEADCVS